MKHYGAFDKMLQEHMEKGFSYETFYATINVPKDAVDSWLAITSFAHAKEIGDGLRRKALENLLLSKLITLDVFEHLTKQEDSDEYGDDIIDQARQRLA
jgi:hypothetical protein